MKLEDIIRTEKELLDTGYKIENNIIEDCDIKVISHFGNIVSLYLYCKNCAPVSGYNNTMNIGFLIKALVEIFDLEDEDGFRLSNLKNVPCRLVTDGNRVVGFGHFMMNKFVLSDDFAKLSE